MAKIKTSRPTPRSNQVIPMPDSSAVALVKKNPPAPSSPPSDLEQEIRLRAYELYQERGAFDGQEQLDWLRAEEEVRSRHQQRQHRA